MGLTLSGLHGGARKLGRRLGHLDVDDQQVFLEHRGMPHQLPLGRDHHRPAVEHQLILSADRVHVHDPRAGLGGSRPAHVQSLGDLVPVIRRAVDVGDDFHLFHGIVVPWLPRLPGVLAYADPQRR